ASLLLRPEHGPQLPDGEPRSDATTLPQSTQSSRFMVTVLGGPPRPSKSTWVWGWSMAGHPSGELLRTLRRRHGLTQAELGRGFCTKAHISAIETGVRAPSGRVVRHLLERLPERRALAEALVASYPPRADWLQAGLALALWGEVAGARTILNAL